MNTLNLDQRMRLILWPILTVLFINTFGVIGYTLSGLDISLGSYSGMAVSFNFLFRVTLLLVSLVFAFVAYDQLQKRMAHEYTKTGEYNMRGRGIKGFIVHVIIGLVEAAFAFLSLNAFWLVVNFSLGSVSLIMQQVYWIGFGGIFIISAYFLTRQTGLAILAYQRKDLANEHPKG